MYKIDLMIVVDLMIKFYQEKDDDLKYELSAIIHFSLNIHDQF